MKRNLGRSGAVVAALLGAHLLLGGSPLLPVATNRASAEGAGAGAAPEAAKRADDRQVLQQLNVEIGNLETQGDRARLAAIVAPQLAFLRANGKIDDREKYLQAVG